MSCLIVVMTMSHFAVVVAAVAVVVIAVIAVVVVVAFVLIAVVFVDDEPSNSCEKLQKRLRCFCHPC